MKTIISFRSLLFIILGFLFSFMNANAEVKISEDKQKQIVTLSNSLVKLEYALKSGTYRIFDNKTGQVIIHDAVYQIFGITGSISSSDEGYQHSWESETVIDELGTGKKFVITSAHETIPNLLWEVTLHKGKSFIVLNAGVDNNTSYHIYLRQMHPVKSIAFKNSNLETNWATLDGNGGAPETKVRTDATLKCWNNLLATFGEDGNRTSLVIGGLTYNEFEKWAELKKSSEGLEIDVWSEDPIGKRLDPGTRYLPNEKYYVDFLTSDPFEALEQYGRSVKAAQKINLPVYDFPTLCLWYSGKEHYGGGSPHNNSVGAVKEMEYVKKSGFLKYSKIAIRLVPDNYQTNNQQG